MPTPGTCVNCGAPLAGEARRAFCPKCLFAQAQSGLFDFNLEGDFGDYELLEEIGRGGMGVVYRARQRSLDRVVAIKRMVFGPGSDPDLVKRFRAEAVSAAALRHPNIVAIHEVGVHEGQHFFVMDYVQGQSLAHLVTAGPLPARRAAGYLKTLAEAVHYAHERGILHRDLKPANVLIDEQDQPRIVDFGLARRLEGASELTVTGQVLGSPHYLPPEQATAQRGRVSRRTDVYGLGATLYHLLTGRPPFQAESLAQTLDLVLHTEPVAPRLLNPSVPRDLETICLKCLEKEPAKRYPTAQMLAEELDRFLDGQPIQARPLGPVGKTWRWCRRNPQMASLATAAALVFVLSFGVVLWQWRKGEAQRVRAETGELLARKNAYAADMREAQRAIADTDLGRARRLLDRYVPTGNAERTQQTTEIDLRGWEWRYLWARAQGEERFTLVCYPESVWGLSFSADGRYLAVRRGGGNIGLWDLAAKRSVAELPGAGLYKGLGFMMGYKAMAFSPMGDLLAWGSTNGVGEPVVRLFNASVGKEIGQLPHSAPIISISFSPAGAAMAVLDNGGKVSVWDLSSQRVITNFVSAPVDVLANRFSPVLKSPVAPETKPQPDGERFAAFDLRHFGCLLFSPDGRVLAVGEPTGRIRLWGWPTGEELRPIDVPPPADGITALAFSPDSKLLAAGCGFADHQVHVWNAATHTEEPPFVGHTEWVASLSFSPDGRKLASASGDHTIRLWDVGGRTERRRLLGNTNEVLAVAWSPGGKELVSGGGDGSVRFWDASAKPAAPYTKLPVAVWFFGPAFLPDSRTVLAVTRGDGSVVQWDPVTQQVERLPFLGTNHMGLDLSRDGRWLALGDSIGNVQVWDFRTHRLVAERVLRTDPPAKVIACGFSPHGKILGGAAFPSEGGTALLKLWRTDGWTEINTDRINLNNVLEADFSQDERTLAVSYQDQTAILWEIATGKPQKFFDARHTGSQIAFSPDGRLFGGVNSSGGITLWNAATREYKFFAHGFRNFAYDLAFSPDSQRVLAVGSSANELVKFWDVATGREIATLPGEAGAFTRLRFSPDGTAIILVSWEGKGLLWRAPSFAEIEAKRKGQENQ